MEDKYGYYGNWEANNGGYSGPGSPPEEPVRRLGRGDNNYYDDFGGYHRPYQPQQRQTNFPMQGSSNQEHAGSFKDYPRNRRAGDDGQESSSDSPRTKKKGVVRIFRRFAENCSMQGPPYIRASTWWLSRLLWTLFFIGALGAMSFHLYYLCKTFFAWPVKNTISLGFSSLQFPAVTVCNVNPVRISMLPNMSADFQDLVNSVQPDRLGRVLDALPRETWMNDRRRRRRRETTDDEEYDTQLDDIDFGISTTNYTNAREDLDDSFYDDNLHGFSESWENEAPESKFYQMEQEFTEIYATEDRKTRIDAGHQLRDMLISCSFAGKSCYAKNFTRITSLKYGNCYTLQYEKFITRQSGPSGGMELLFFLDTAEYIRGITPDDGLQVTIHPPDTMPFPADEGLAVAAGTFTMLSLKLMQIERKGPPYGQCTDSDTFLKQYNIKYSRQVCQKFCEQSHLHNSCGCRDETKDDLNIIMKARSIRPCRKKSEIECMVQSQWAYRQGDVQCNCNSPCSEFKYEKTMSFRPWPNKDYAREILLKTICFRESSTKCAHLTGKDARGLSHEFVKLNIFYEDLNYENITEVPDYEDVQFISDVGGTLGLWIGLSVLSICEVLQLFTELIRYLCCCRWKPTNDAPSR